MYDPEVLTMFTFPAHLQTATPRPILTTDNRQAFEDLSPVPSLPDHIKSTARKITR